MSIIIWRYNQKSHVQRVWNSSEHILTPVQRQPGLWLSLTFCAPSQQQPSPSLTITLVSTIEEALEWREKNPQLLLMGEVEGLPIPGFDFGNSPPQFDSMDLSGRHLVQRTTSGTQGVVRSQKADILLTASFCNVGATARYISALAPEKVTYVITGLRPGGWGDEDAACADYLSILLKGRNPSHAPYLQRVRESPPGRLFLDAEKIEFDYQDLEYCLAINRFNFAMPVSKQDGRLIIVAHPC